MQDGLTMVTEPEPITCTIAFAGEAHDSAADAYRRIAGYEVRVTTNAGETFDAFIGEAKDASRAVGADAPDPLRVNEETGQYEVFLTRTDEHSKPTGVAGWADIYDDIAKVVVY